MSQTSDDAPSSDTVTAGIRVRVACAFLPEHSVQVGTEGEKRWAFSYTVTITNENTGLELTAVTDATGTYTIRNITGGTYTPGHISEMMRVCKLYDYERHLWLNFAGEVTAIPRTAAPRDGEGRPVVMAGVRPVPDPSDYVLAGASAQPVEAAELAKTQT